MRKEILKQTRKVTNGITLVALVVTIVVLLILAGITLTYVLGDNSVFKQASKAKIQTEIGKIEERAQVIYSEKLMKTASSTLSAKVETSEVIEQLRTEGYTIEQRAVSEGDITGISLDKESMTIGKNKTVEIKVTYEGVNDPFVYYVEVQGKYYQMHSNKGFITIDKEASNLTKTDFENENSGEGAETTLTITTNPTDIVTASLKVGSNNTIEITSTETEGETVVTVSYGSYEKTCTVKVVEPVLATGIALNEIEYVVTGGESWTNDLQLIATLEPSNATEKEVTWTSSNPEIATVDNKGLVKAGTKGGDVIIMATTKDGTNLSAKCKITTELFGEIKTNKTSYTDSEGNVIQIPRGFAVGISENVNKVTGGLVIQDNEGNQFVWIPVGDFNNGNGEKDHITLGRYSFGSNGTPKLMQNANNYTQIVSISGYKGNYQELVSGYRNTPAKNLEDFITETNNNKGYYFARYEASKGTDGKVKSQYNKVVWGNITQPASATEASGMYRNNYIQSDLMNSYSWDTAIVFIQKYSIYNNYSRKASVNNSSMGKLNTGKIGDKVCNIHDMASNCYEWSTEFSTSGWDCGIRGGRYNSSDTYTAYRTCDSTTYAKEYITFRVILYF